MVSNFNLVMCDSDLRKNILDKVKPLRDKLLLDMEIDRESDMIIHICDKVLELDKYDTYDYIYSKIWRWIDRPPNFNCPDCGERNECDCVSPHISIFTDRKEGNSKMSGGIFKEALFGVIQMKIKSWFTKYQQ